MPRTGKLVVISGPSGVGKSTLVRQALARTDVVFSVSVTTRPPRPGEVDGRDYRFVDRPTFERMIADGELLEWAEVFGQYYGTPAGPVRQALKGGKTVILQIDVQGGLQVHEKMPESTFVWIRPPSDAELQQRLSGRGTEPAEDVRRRLDAARAEIRTAEASGVYTHTVINDDLDRAVNEVVEILSQEQNRR